MRSISNKDLLLSVISLDAYYRGLDAPEIGLDGVNIGGAVYQAYDSGLGGEYVATKYTLGGETIIAFRGTDNPLSDLLTGWGGGAGFLTPQAIEAGQTYRDWIGNESIYDANVTLTGHSLGGGLAGLLATLYGKEAVVFDSMAFNLAASNIYHNATHPFDWTGTQYLPNPDHAVALDNFYGQETPRQLPVDGTDIYGFQVRGQALDFNTVTGVSDLTTFSQGNPYGSAIHGILNPKDLHSMSLLTTMMYAQKWSQENITYWTPLRGNIWVSLFDEEIARASRLIGVVDAESMRAKIAYTSVDGPFGNVAIAGLFNDANEFGYALASDVQSPGEVSKLFSPEDVQAFVDIFAQRAAMAANGKLTSSVSFSSQGIAQSLEGKATVISVDGDAKAWKIGVGASTERTEIVGFEALKESLVAQIPGISDSPLKDQLEAMLKETKAIVVSHDGSLADDMPAHIRIEDAVKTLIPTDGDHKDYYISTPDNPTTLTFGTSQDDHITGTDNSEIIVGGRGSDIIFGGKGQDFLIGDGGIEPDGATDILILGEAGEDTPGKPASGKLDGFDGGVGMDKIVFGNTNGQTLVISAQDIDALDRLYLRGDMIRYSYEGLGQDLALFPLLGGVNADAVYADQQGYPSFTWGLDSDGDGGKEYFYAGELYHATAPHGTVDPTPDYSIALLPNLNIEYELFTDYLMITVYKDPRYSPNGGGGPSNTDFFVQIKIEGFQNGNYGIQLDGELAPWIMDSWDHTDPYGDYAPYPYDLSKYNELIRYINRSGAHESVIVKPDEGGSPGSQDPDEFRPTPGFQIRQTGTDTSNSIQGSELAEMLSGLDGDDVLEAGEGNDDIRGGDGSDTYVVSQGDGIDEIREFSSESSEVDVLRFKDILPSQVTLTQTGTDIVISIDGGQKIVLKNQLLGSGSGIEKIVFDNGIEWTSNDFAPLPSQIPQTTIDTFEIDQDSLLNLNASHLIGNDAGYAGSTLTLVSVGGAQHGQVTLGTNGGIEFSPQEGFTGLASFEYIVEDANSHRAIGRANILVNPTNHDPSVLEYDAGYISPDSQYEMGGGYLASLVEDIDGDNIVLVSVQNGINGSVTYDPVNDAIIFVPNTGFTGTASFQFTVSDGRGGTATGTVNVNVTTTPIATDDSLGVWANVATTITTAQLLANDNDPDGDNLTITDVIAGLDTHGSVILDQNGNIRYVPDNGYVGPATFTYYLTDQFGAVTSATVTLDVTDVGNSAPVAANDAGYQTDEDTPILITASSLTSNDSDPDADPVVLYSVQDATHGTVKIVNGDIVFTPDQNYNGPATFTYTISDGKSGLSTATVNIVVNSINDTPAAKTDKGFVVVEDVPLTIAAADLLSNDVDVDGTLTVTSVQDAIGGTVAIVNGNVVFTPEDDFTGLASFTYTVNDGNGGTSTAIVKLVVTPANDAPTANDDSVRTSSNKPAVVAVSTLLSNDIDVDGESLQFGGIESVTHGSAFLSNGNIVFIPDADYAGTAHLTYSVIDSAGITSTATVTFTVTPADNVVSGTAGADTLSGTAGDDSLYGDSGDDTIDGAGGNDFLNGGSGADTLTGGQGDDVFVVDDVGDVVQENSNEGIDIVHSSISHALSANVENINLTGTGAINGTGNALDNLIFGNGAANTLTGGAGNDRLDGEAGADTLIGGTGNDFYVVDDAGDTITENTSEGDDWVQASISLSLGANLENLILNGATSLDGAGNSLDNTLVGNGGDNTLLGEAGNDTLYGNGGDDILDGGSGTDSLHGGDGNDVYRIHDVGDTVTEEIDGGIDLVLASITSSLAANVENLTLDGVGGISGTGNAEANVITGNSSANSLYGMGGNDTLVGGLGDDTLDGGSGHDNMLGGEGDDVYVVDALADSISEEANEGTDTVRSSVTHVLGDHLENLVLTGDRAIDGTGNTLSNAITGNANNNMLDGGAGDDVLSGGEGNDLYIVDDVDDVILEDADEGDDTVRASVNYTLAAHVETLLLAGNAISGTGNDGDNLIVGNAGANILNGGSGNDRLDGGTGQDVMAGGAGNDTFYFDNEGDVATENANEGVDEVLSSVSTVLGENIENLRLIGNLRINGTGNGLANTIVGNGINNTLDGGAGNDMLIGGDGRDTYIVDSAGDVVVEDADEGVDEVQSSVTYTIADNVENLTLTGSDDINATGNGAQNTLLGNEGNNILDGKGGADYMNGGYGDDIYYVDNSGDQISESSFNNGHDEVRSFVTFEIDSFGVEDLTLLGSDAINGTGNSRDNLITGNSASNELYGLGGNDTLHGGDGDDYLDGGAGNDVLDGQGGSNYLYGGEGDDELHGGTSFNALLGQAGNDSFIGGTGDETMQGEDGDDKFSGGGGTSWIETGDGNDLIVLADDASFMHVFDFADGLDKIDVRSTGLTLGNIDDYVDIVEYESGVSIQYGTTEIWLPEIAASSISFADDFRFS